MKLYEPFYHLFFKETEQTPLNTPRQQKNKIKDFTYDVLGDFYKEKETGHLNGFLSTIDNYNDPWEKERKLDSIRNVYYHPPYVSSDTTLLNSIYKKQMEQAEKINTAKFEHTMPFTFEHEGGYSNRKNDRGGKTNHGIIASFLNTHKSALGNDVPKDIKSLTKEQATKLYKSHWDLHNIGKLKDKDMTLLINDYAINSNPYKVIERIQGILNKKGFNLETDGLMGPNTIKVINSCEREWLIEEILKDRAEHYDSSVEKVPGNIDNIDDWINRLNDLSKILGSELRFKSKYSPKK